MDPRPLRVLVADDYPDQADSLALPLPLLGHKVRVTYDGPTALKVARAILPHIVLLDLGLPGMDGYEVARRMREEAPTAKTLLVAVTGFGQERDRERCREAGFDDFLLKPVEPQELVGLLRRLAEAAGGPPQ